MKEALKLALETLESMKETLAEHDEPTTFNEDQAITAIKEALAQPEKEPTYGSEEVRKLREVIASQAKIIEDHIPDAKKMVAQPEQKLVGTVAELFDEGIIWKRELDRDLLVYIASPKEKNT